MFCSNCGKEISENSAFCSNCGKQIVTATKTGRTGLNLKNGINQIKDKLSGVNQINNKINFAPILTKAKTHFTNFYVNYNSLFFKFAMAIMLAVGLSDNIVSIINRYLYDIIPTWSKYVYTIYEPALCLLLFGIFALIFKSIKKPEVVKPSAILVILWIGFSIFNVLIFLADMELPKYILYSGLSDNVVEMFLIISMALLLFKNHPKYPFVLIISLLSYALLNMSLWLLKSSVLLYRLNNEFSNLLDVMHSLGMCIFIVASFLVRYLFGDKVSKWIIGVLAVLMAVVNGFECFDSFSIQNIINFITKIAIVFAIVFFAFSCGRNTNPENFAECKPKGSKRAVVIGLASIVVSVVIVFVYLLTSAIVCANQINKGIRIWKEDITNGNIETDSQWDQVNNDIRNYICDGLVSAFVDDYGFYTTFKENSYKMERITKCHSAYKNGNFTEEVAEEYGSINVDESWRNDEVLVVYYEKYMAMKPSLENVSAQVGVDVDNRKITVTVVNDNVTPLNSCTVNCHFTIGFVETGYYSNDIEYGRGERTFVIEDIPGSSEKVMEYSFDPDQYYDSYGSYIISFLHEKSIEIISME